MENEKPRRGRGRPSRAEASRKALAGIDPSTVDPLDVLRAVAADCSAPASARVSAAKALLADKLDREIRRANEEAMATGPARAAAGLVSWLEKQPASGQYEYGDPFGCFVAQWVPSRSRRRGNHVLHTC